MVIHAPGSRDATSCLGAKEECKGASAVFRALFDDHAANLTPKIIGIYVVLIVANVAAWAWALGGFRPYPVLLGTALLAYGFGLRHAVDADHIAAIDNVTRKLMQEKKRPVTVGFFFSLGHSTVVVVMTILIALAAVAVQNFDQMKAIGGLIGTAISSL